MGDTIQQRLWGPEARICTYLSWQTGACRGHHHDAEGFKHLRTEHSPKVISRSTLWNAFLVSGCVLVPSLRKPGTEGPVSDWRIGLVSCRGMFHFRQFCNKKPCHGCPTWMLIACDVAKQQWGDCAPFSETRGPIFERAEILLLIQLWSLGLANLLALRIRTSGIWEATFSYPGQRSQQYIHNIGWILITRGIAISLERTRRIPRSSFG